MGVCGELVRVGFILNGVQIERTVPRNLSLLQFLREYMHLTGTKNGCGKGQCGACTVTVNGKARRSCLLKATDVAGSQVLTIEGIGSLEKLHPLQRAFVEAGAVQCGFCTPGLIMTAKALIDRNPDPSDDEIRRSLKGNLCRCAAYSKIVEAIHAASRLSVETVGGQVASAGSSQYPLGVIGHRIPRKDAWLKVTGSLQYAADMHIDGMLYGKILWSAHPHAQIVTINTEEASRLPGVHAVLTEKDVPGPNDIGAGQPVLARGKVRFVGDPVAVVFAESEDIAEEAAAKIHVAYRELEGVFSPFEAFRPSAPNVHETGNVSLHIPFHKGDVRRGFEQADVIVEQAYYTPFVEHAYLETEAGVAAPSDDGGVTIWICTQMPRDNRDLVANALALPREKVRIAETPCGGAFGGKFTVSIHALLGLGVRCTGKPVKIVLDRQESMRMHLKRNAVHLEYKIGATEGGRLTALEAKIISDQGAYSPIGDLCLEQMVVFAAGPYVIPNVKIDAYNVYTNKVPGGAMRGFGDNMVTFAMESQMDILASKIGMDPFKIRLINALKIGEATGSGQILKASVAIEECILEARKRLDAEVVPLLEPNERIGIGVAAGFKNVGGGGSCGAAVELTEEGEFIVKIECPDIGQGSNTTMAQIAGEVLGTGFNSIHVLSGDTHLAPPTGFTGAQRVTINAGNAVVKACKSVKRKILSFASEELRLDEALLNFAGDAVVETRDDSNKISLKELRHSAAAKGIDLSTEEYYEMPEVFPLSPTGNMDMLIEPDKYANYPTYSYVVHVAIVKVDEKSGNVKVLKVIAVHDAGKVLNPLNCEAQIEGATMMGLGYALTEEFIIKNGWNITDSIKKCRIPTLEDAPVVNVVLVEDPEPLGPFQAKGLSEAATIAITPAIINAICDAVGVRITELPATEEKVRNAIASGTANYRK